MAEYLSPRNRRRGSRNKLSRESDDGFTRLHNGKDLDSWAGAVESYEVKDGAILCKKGKGRCAAHQGEFGRLHVRLEFKLPPGGNNGLAIRYPGQGDTAYDGMCELQILDDNYEKVTAKLDPRQAHGSVYGMIAGASRISTAAPANGTTRK